MYLAFGVALATTIATALVLYYQWRVYLVTHRHQHEKLMAQTARFKKMHRRKRAKCVSCGSTTWPEIQPCGDCQMRGIPEVGNGEILLDFRSH